MISERINFQNICVVKAGWLGWIVKSPQQIWNRVLILENMYVAIVRWLRWISNSCQIIPLEVSFRKYVCWNRGWLGWLARIRFLKDAFFHIVCVTNTVKMVDLVDLVDLVDVVDLVDLGLYPKHIRRICWLTWVTCHFSQKFPERIDFEHICVVINGWLGWLAESSQLNWQRDLIF